MTDFRQRGRFREMSHLSGSGVVGGVGVNCAGFLNRRGVDAEAEPAVSGFRFASVVSQRVSRLGRDRRGGVRGRSGFSARMSIKAGEECESTSPVYSPCCQKFF